MPPKRKKPSNDPLNTAVPTLFDTVTIKQELEENVIDFGHESADSFGDFAAKPEPSSGDESELLEELEEFPSASEEEPKKKKTRYSRADIETAAELVASGKMTNYKAALIYGIPRTTLMIYVRHKREGRQRMKMGAHSVLTSEEELELLEWLNTAADYGTPRRREELLQAAADMPKLKKRAGFKNELPTSSWLDRFISRQKRCVKYRRPFESVDEKTFFTKFYKFLEKSQLMSVLERPDAFYVIEDATFELTLRANNSLTRGLLRKTLMGKGGEVKEFRKKDSVTVTYCFGADGRKLQELVIFNENFKDIVKVALVDRELKSNFLFSQTSKGGHTPSSLKCYLQRLDQDLAKVQRPIFFFCSETLPGVNIELFRWCRERQIHIISYIPREISVLELLNAGIFGVNNEDWRREIEAHKDAHQRLSECDFIRRLKTINDREIDEKRIVDIFEKIGIFPFDVSKVGEDDDANEVEDVKSEEQAEKVEVKPRSKDKVVLKQLRKMRQLSQELRKIFEVKGMGRLNENLATIDRQLNIIEDNM